MKFEIADNIWCEFNRVNREAGFDPQKTAARFLTSVVGELAKQRTLKSTLGDAWKVESWRMYPVVEFATFDIAGAPKADLPDEIVNALETHCDALGVDAQSFASYQLGLVTNGLAKKYLGQPSIFSL